MPPVLALTLGYGAGLWTGLVALVPPAVPWAAAIGAAAVWSRSAWGGTLLAAAVVGALAGGQHARRQATSCAAVWEIGPVAFRAGLHDAPGARGTTTATVLQAAGGCGGAVRLRFSERGVPAGTTLLIVGRYRGGGTVLVAHARMLRAPAALRYRARAAVARRIRALYGADAPVVEAMLIGRREDIPPSLRSRFVDAGIAHLLAISGLHVGIVAAWIMMVLRWVGLTRVAWPLSVLGTWVYVGLLGFPAPATRAATFVLLHAVARWRQRHPPASATLAVAVLAVLAFDPGAVTAAGAWLSVAAVWGTVRGPQWLPSRLGRRPVLRLLAASVGAVSATAPITAFAFGSVAPIGVVSNLLAIPLAGVVVPGVFASLAAGEVMAEGARTVLRILDGMATLAAAVPGGHLVTTPGAAAAVPWIAVLLLVAAGPGPALWRRVRQLASGAAALSWIVAVGRVGPRDPPGTLALHVLDVGQGDAVAIRTPGSQWILVDAGPRTAHADAGRDVVVPFLRDHGVRRLAAAVVSHGDADHLGGMPAVLDAVDVDRVLEPGQPLASSLYREYLAAVDGRGIPWHAARAGDSLTVDAVTLRVLHPSAEWMARGVDVNENSVVLVLTFGCFEALLVGDAGLPAESAMLDRTPDVDLLKVGHHGSAGSTSAGWLDAARPEVAVISVGRNGYGHPAPAVLERLARHGSVTWRTDRGGTVTILTDGSYLSVGQRQFATLGERIRCRILRLSRSSASSSSRRSCSPRPPASSRMCSTTSRLRPR